MQDFRKIEVWQIAHQLTLSVYKITREFPTEERFGLTSQMRRSSASIAANIAEGCVRSSDSDFARFLYNSLGSASELEYFALLSRDLGYFDEARFELIASESQRVKRMLTSFIQRLKTAQPTADSRQRIAS